MKGLTIGNVAKQAGVRSIACPSCDIQIRDMRSDKAVRAKAKEYGFRYGVNWE